MTKIKKFLGVALAAAIVATVGGCFSACGSVKHKVSSIEDLYAMKSNKSYSLTCDLDLKWRDWTPLQVVNFDGNGHTIKNCTINETLTQDGGFFTRVEKLNNVTFDGVVGNVSFAADEAYNGVSGGIAAGTVYKEIKNVTVINSDMIFLVTGAGRNVNVNIGGIAGEYWGGTPTFSTGITGVYNCALKDSSLSVTSKSGSLSVGGILGQHESKELFDCTVADSNVSSPDSGNFGGIVGKIFGVCEVKGCAFLSGSIETGGGNVGSIVGGLAEYMKVNLSQCAAFGGTITVNSKNNYSVGGIAGLGRDCKITDCLVSGMNIECATSSNASNGVCRVGGLCGSSSETLAKNIVYDSRVSGTGYTGSKNMVAAGLVASLGGSVNGCAVYGVSVSGGKRDIFCPASDAVFNSFIGESVVPNANDIPVITEQEWENILTKLSMDNNIWTFDGGKPSLKNVSLNYGGEAQ